MKIYVSIISLLLISGCKSEIDKCVDAQVVAWKERGARNQKLMDDKIKQAKIEGKTLTLADWMDIDSSPEMLESEVIAKARIDCQKH